VALSVSRETLARLDVLSVLLSKWNQSLNLVAKASLRDVSTRHIDDSAQLVKFLPPTARHWVDIGSGGGFPGLVVAAMLWDTQPQCRISLIEADKRKCVFLREAARHMEISVDVRAERIETASPLQADVLSARALAAVPALCKYARRHLVDGGIALFMKGANHQAEIEDATAQGWCFELTTHKSITDSDGMILELRNIRNDLG
jgi:16S rRNA (guanine527-N7)-methyltransferase